MKAFIVASLLMSFAHAKEVNEVNIKNFNFSYRSPSGEGVAEVFNYKNALNNAQKIYVEKHGEDFHFNYEGVENGEFTFKGAPALLTEAEEITLSKFNLELSQKVSLDFASASFVKNAEVQNVQNLKVNCARKLNAAEFYEQFITGCIESMTLNVASVQSSAEKNLGIKSIELQVKNGNLNLSADVKAQISGKVRGKGTASYKSADKTVTIKLTEVKFGILDVSNMVFDELKKMESENLKVQKPFVYVKLQ